MICPHCGFNEAENAAMCSKCHYKFSAGHAFNDPAAGFSVNFSKGKGRKLFIFILVAVFIFMIYIWLRAV